MSHHDPRILSIVVPAHDEERLLPAALAALRLAADEMPGLHVEVTVVANACTDRTVEVAAQAGALVIESDVANVGAARAAGFAAAIERHRGALGELWLATTDADSQVPLNWISAQVAAATTGCDVFLGTVQLAPADRSRFRAWTEEYEAKARRQVDHGHVHGANMGMRALVYLRLGGFRPLQCGEDVDLVHRAADLGATIAWSCGAAVVTSGRRIARASHGVAADLARSLDAGPPRATAG